MSANDLSNELRQLAQMAGDLRPVAGQIGSVFADAVLAHFDSRGSGEWAAWSDEYASLPYSRRGPGRSMLVRDGDLLASLADTSHHQHITRTTTTSIEVGTSRPTATLHRQGRRGGRGGQMPARDPMPPASRFEQRWMDTLHAHLAGDGQQRLGM